jgi:broad specificity phosphatase PhoE
MCFSRLHAVKKQVKNLLELNQVIIIRHGEKTPADPVNLSKPGEVRANHLPALLLDKDSPWKRPDVLYAMKQSGPKGSRRPLETVLPLAEALKIAVNEGKQTRGG